MKTIEFKGGQRRIKFDNKLIMQPLLFEAECKQARIIKDSFYGLAYNGSKRKIAKFLLQEIANNAPECNNFYDLFGGGGAMSLCALDNGYNVFYNELDTIVYNYFKGAELVLKGEWNLENLPKELLQFYTKKQYLKVKQDVANGNINPINAQILFTFSFGTKGKYYFCSKAKEFYKKLMHNFVVFKDRESAKELDRLYKKDEVVSLAESLLDLPSFTSAPLYTRLDIFLDLAKKNYILFECLLNAREFYDESIKDIRANVAIENLARQKFLQNLNNLKHLFNLPRNSQTLTLTNDSYENIPIQDNSIIYCDIPYRNTEKYNLIFDYEKFYKWAYEKGKQGYKIFISEYDMPSDLFTPILTIKTKSMLDSGNNNRQVLEKLFIPKI